MPRIDLLALTPDDLATLSNRGTVKRAQRELESGEVRCDIQENEASDLVFQWSDGVTCRFPAGRTVHEAICSSGLAGISRHIVRSVLWYQQALRPETSPSTDIEAGRLKDADSAADSAQTLPAQSPHHGVWDPGAISDEDLVRQYRKSAVAQARKRFEQGVLVELTRGAKPVARFLDEGCTIRFLVPGDVRYVAADCAETLLPTRVPLAVWAFRELPAGQLAGLLSLQQSEPATPRALLASLDSLLDELFRDGMNGVPGTWPERLGRLAESLRDEELVWPAELLADLHLQAGMYRQHDARFDPVQVVQLAGELIARTRAISGGTKAVPQPLIRGTKSDRPIDIAGGRLIGVGLGIRHGKRHTTIHAYLQDAGTGSVVAVERTFADPDPKSGESPRSYSDLAATVLSRGVTLAGLASSQLLVKSGRRTASGQLVLPRTASSLMAHPQNFQWEQLTPPFVAESFAQLSARFQALPPSFLRPRRCTENLHVVPLRGAANAHFDSARQRLTARLVDPEGGEALLVFPFHSRGAEGFNELVGILESRGDQVCFVSGHVRSRGRLLEIQPIFLVMTEGVRRVGINPWLPRRDKSAESTQETVAAIAGSHAGPMRVEHFVDQLNERLSDLMLTGVRHSNVQIWGDLSRLGKELGFARMMQPVDRLAETLGLRGNSLHWKPDAAIALARQLCLLSRLAIE